jgi:competence protein ComEC
MPIIHFLNVLEGDCNIIQHDIEKRVTVIDVSNAYNDEDTKEEKEVKAYKNISKHVTGVPTNLQDFRQKETPDNPIIYLKENLKVDTIFRFIITQPDMDHLDGIEDLYSELSIINTWDTDNTKELDKKPSGGRYNPNDWNFYTQIRDGKYDKTKRLTLTAGENGKYWDEDCIKVLCPTIDLMNQANESSGDYHDLSYLLLFTAPKKNGGTWKIVFAGDSHDKSWEYILDKYKEDVADVDVLFAPHHGRDSERSYEFLETLKPRLTLFGNAASEHLAYDSYPKIRITNNQAGYVILDINEDRIFVLVKNQKFAEVFRNRRGWPSPSYYSSHKAYGLFQFEA